MKKRFISFLMAIIMAVTLLPLSGCGASSEAKRTISRGEMLTEICHAFGMTGYMQEKPYIPSVDTDNQYFDVVQACVEWGIITTNDQKYAVESTVIRSELAIAVVNAAELTTDNATKEEKLSIAAKNALVETSGGEIRGDEKVTPEEAGQAIAAAQELWANKTYTESYEKIFYQDGVKDYSEGYSGIYTLGQQTYIPISSDVNIQPGDVYLTGPIGVNDTSSAFIAESVEEQDGYYVITNSATGPELENIVTELQEQGTITPNLLTDCVLYDGDGNPINLTAGDTFTTAQRGGGRYYAGTLAGSIQGKGSFTLSNGTKISLSVSSSEYDFSVKVPINDYLSYEGSFKIDDLRVTHDVDFDVSGLKSATLKTDYKVTIDNGVKAKTDIPPVIFAPYDNRNNGFLSAVKQSRAKFMGDNYKGAQSIKIGTISLAGSKSCGINLVIQLKFTLEGTAKISVTLGGSKGVEYKNKTMRYIKTNNTDWDISLKGKFEVTPSVGIQLNFWKKDILGFSVDGGVGVQVELVFHLADSENHLIDEGTADIPGDLGEKIGESDIQSTKSVIAAVAESQGGHYVYTSDDPVNLHCDVCFNAKLYWILKVGVDDECLASSLLKGTNIQLSVEFLNDKNAQFAHWHLEDWKDVGQCTRSYTPFDMDNLEETIKKDKTEQQQDGGILDLKRYTLTITVDESAQIEVTSMPDGSSASDLIWSSSDTGIAAVDEGGNVTGVVPGNAVITVQMKDNPAKKVQCSVFVTDNSKSTWEFLSTAIRKDTVYVTAI